MRLIFACTSAVLLLLAMGVFPCLCRAETADKPPSSLESILDRGELRVGITPLAPLAMLDKNQKWIGLEIDVAERLARDLGVALQLCPVPAAELVSRLSAGEFDVIVSGFAMTAQRARQVAFSRPYYTTEIRLVASKQAAAGKSLAEFNAEGTAIGLVAGQAGRFAAAEAFPLAAPRCFATEESLLDALLAGEVAAAVVSDQLLRFNVAFHANKLFWPENAPLTKRPVAVALRPDEPRLLEFLNAWVSIVLAEGWVRERRAFWYEQSSWIKDLPPGVFP